MKVLWAIRLLTFTLDFNAALAKAVPIVYRVKTTANIL